MPRTLKIRLSAPFLLLLLLLTVPVALAAQYTWSSGETVRATNLNANFTEVYALANATITNARISASAAIAHSKLATPALVPKAVIAIMGACSTSSNCTVAYNYGAAVTTVAQGSTAGEYTVTWTSARSNASYVVAVTSFGSSGGPHICSQTGSPTTTTFLVKCTDNAGAAASAGFTATVFDDNDT